MVPKSLAEFKRVIDQHTCELTHNTLMGGEIPDGHKLKGARRRVIRKQTNSVQFEGGSWYEYPPAKAVTFTPDTEGTGFVARTDMEGGFYMLHHYRPIETE